MNTASYNEMYDDDHDFEYDEPTQDASPLQAKIDQCKKDLRKALKGIGMLIVENAQDNGAQQYDTSDPLYPELCAVHEEYDQALVALGIAATMDMPYAS